MRILIFLLILIIISNCRKKGSYYEKIQTHNIVIVPKIKYNQECERKTDGFFQRFGASISNFYLEQDAIRVNNDSIGILQPFYTYNSYGECYPEKIENNLLIVYNFKENETKVYDNILIPDSINSYQTLIPNKSSFIIHSEQGHSSTFSAFRNLLFRSIIVGFIIRIKNLLFVICNSMSFS